MSQQHRDLSVQLQDTLSLMNPPLAITFVDTPVDGVEQSTVPWPVMPAKIRAVLMAPDNRHIRCRDQLE